MTRQLFHVKNVYERFSNHIVKTFSPNILISISDSFDCHNLGDKYLNSSSIVLSIQIPDLLVLNFAGWQKKTALLPFILC